jgi:hypothetical protein
MAPPLRGLAREKTARRKKPAHSGREDRKGGLFFTRTQALRPGLNCGAPLALREKEDAAFGLGTLKRRPYKWGPEAGKGKFKGACGETSRPLHKSSAAGQALAKIFS